MKETMDAILGGNYCAVDYRLLKALLQQVLAVDGNGSWDLANSQNLGWVTAKDTPESGGGEPEKMTDTIESGRKRSKSQATILVVEDRELDREMLTGLLEHARYRVLEAVDGPQALELIRSQHPDLVISDVLLPKMDGYQLVRELRADPAVSATNVIFYTAVFNEREAWDLAREIGVARIICKPMEPAKILTSVAEVLESKVTQQPPVPPPAGFEEKHLQLLVDKLIGQVKALQRSEAGLHKKSQILQGINRVFHEALTCDTEEELARTSLEVAKSLTGGTAALMGKVNQARKLEVTHSDWADCPMSEASENDLPDKLQHLGGFFQKIIVEGRSLIANNPAGHPGSNFASPDCSPFTAFLGAPLKYIGQTIGLIALGNKEGGFDPADLEALENLSFAIVEALMRKRGEAALKQAREELEWRVEERTAELKTAVDRLQAEVEMRQEAEEEVQIINEELEQRVRERTAELETANKELEAFSYSVSHDLKTPIRAIEGFSRILMGEHSDKLDAEGLRLLKVITENTKLMHHLIDDLIGLARLVRQPLKKHVIDLGGMAKQVFERLRGQAPKRKLHLIVKELPPAYGDHSLLYQLMMNLLDNAIKYADPKEAAVIEVGGWSEEKEIICYVKDNGIGFDERYGDKIFGPFQRLHSAGEYDGTGIGLAIVQRIIHRHGGRVWAEGTVNEGATFYFALPKNGELAFSGRG